MKHNTSVETLAHREPALFQVLDDEGNVTIVFDAEFTCQFEREEITLNYSSLAEAVVDEIFDLMAPWPLGSRGSQTSGSRVSFPGRVQSTIQATCQDGSAAHTFFASQARMAHADLFGDLFYSQVDGYRALFGAAPRPSSAAAYKRTVRVRTASASFLLTDMFPLSVDVDKDVLVDLAGFVTVES